MKRYPFKARSPIVITNIKPITWGTKEAPNIDKVSSIFRAILCNGRKGYTIRIGLSSWSDDYIMRWGKELPLSMDVRMFPASADWSDVEGDLRVKEAKEYERIHVKLSD